MTDDGETPADFAGPIATMVDFALTSVITASVLLDGGGFVESASPAALTTLGVGPDRLRGRTVDHALGIEVAQLPQRGVDEIGTGQAAANGQVVHWRAMELGGARADGGWLVEFQIDDRAAGSIDDRGRRLDEIILELDERHAQLDRYLGLISHDLQSPTRTLLAWVQLVRNEVGDAPATAISGLDAIERGARYLLRLTTELLQFSQLSSESLELELVDAQAVLDAALEQLAVELEDVGAQITVDRPLPTVAASPGALGVVFQHLIDNAVSYRGDDPPEISFTWSLDHDVVTISVADNGTGIAPEQHSAVFQPGRRLVAGDQQHTGLGLATSREIVERFGGTIEVSASEPGSGATFVVSLSATLPP